MSWDNQKVEVKKKPSLIKPVVEFKSLSEVAENRGIKILSYGNFSTGKTHFALSSPSPVFIIDTENGASPLAKKFPDAKVLNISNMGDNDIEEKDEVKNFTNYMNAVDYLCSRPEIETPTIIVDSISDIWEWAQAYAKIKVFKIGIDERLKQQWDWGVINKLYLKPLKKLINKNCNLIITSRETEAYSGPGQPTGKFAPKCQKKTPYWVDLVLHHEMKFINKQLMFQAKIEKCRQKGELIGRNIDNPTIDKIKEMLK